MQPAFWCFLGPVSRRAPSASRACCTLRSPVRLFSPSGLSSWGWDVSPCLPSLAIAGRLASEFVFTYCWGGGGGGGWGRRENPRVAGPGAALVLAPLGGVVRALRRFAAAWGFLSSGFPPNLADAPAAIASFQHVLLAARLSAFSQSSPPRPCRGRGGGGY